MRKLVAFLVMATTMAAGARPQDMPEDFVLIEGGTFVNARSNFHGTAVTISDFYIGKYEVTQKEWTEVMGNNPSQFKGDDRPVEMVSWYDAVEYCNKRSIREGLQPYYSIDTDRKDPANGNDADTLKWTVTVNEGANGYRLPTEAEWEYAATGGRASKGYTYSGGNEIGTVAWFWQNSGAKALAGLWNWPAIEANGNSSRPVGTRDANELGLHDMSGNVREWCWDWLGEPASAGADPSGPPGGIARVWKGGGWLGADFCCEPAFRSGFEPYGKGPDQGLRLCRDR